MQYITKNALRIWGTLGLLWCKFACIKKKNLRDPGPQAFGFLTSARAVFLWVTWYYLHSSMSQVGLFPESQTWKTFKQLQQCAQAAQDHQYWKPGQKPWSSRPYEHIFGTKMVDFFFWTGDYSSKHQLTSWVQLWTGPRLCAASKYVLNRILGAAPAICTVTWWSPQGWKHKNVDLKSTKIYHRYNIPLLTLRFSIGITNHLHDNSESPI